MKDNGLMQASQRDDTEDPRRNQIVPGKTFHPGLCPAPGGRDTVGRDHDDHGQSLRSIPSP